jgi:mannose-6-phosphate isomerase-like protein (cupin superfamily)
MTSIPAPNPAAETLTAERCFITELLNRPDDPTCSLARARVAPGVTTQRHVLVGTTERYVILAGTGRVEIGDAPAFDVAPPAVVHIPAGTPQRITNTGATDLIFLCLCTPRFTAEAYQSLE